MCLGVKINTNVDWQRGHSEDLYVASAPTTLCTHTHTHAVASPPPSPVVLTTALRSMALSFTPCVPVHYLKIDTFVRLVSGCFFFFAADTNEEQNGSAICHEKKKQRKLLDTCSRKTSRSHEVTLIEVFCCGCSSFICSLGGL